MLQLLRLTILLATLLNGGETTSCLNTSATADTKPLYLLTLASIPKGLTALSGARIARDDINNHTDLLPGYHIELIVDTIEECSSFEAGIGLSNLVKYTVSPPCRPVVAVIGLGCSSHTSLLSPVAGHDGYDLIQLSSANSPIFQTQNYRFPHLWQFLGSATVYSDTILAIMDQYNWNRISVVFNVESVFYTGIANDIEQKVKVSGNMTIVFILGMRKTKDFYLDAAISNIKSQQTTILVSLLNLKQEAALLDRAIDENLVYPDYTWIHVERLPQHLNATRGHIYLHTQTTLKPDTVLVSGEMFAEFKGRHSEDIKLIEQQYNHYNLTPSVFASYWYDQVWAIALAVNNSLPVLENRNLSIDNYTIGQREITDVIEEQMANLSFQGAGGWVEFNQYHSVSTPAVEIYWVTGNGTRTQVGLFNPHNKSNFFISINQNVLPRDMSLQPVNTDYFPIPVTILFYLLGGALFLLITTQLALVFYFRNHKAIKATSPNLSILIFVGCYLLCFGALLTTTDGGFKFAIPELHSFLLFDIAFFLDANGGSLILVTITIRLLRVYRIFLCDDRFHLSKHWKNARLIIIGISISLLSNITVAFFIINTYIDMTFLLFASSIVLLSVFFYTFEVITLFLAIRTHKIKYKNFKDTNEITFFIALMIVTLSIAFPASIILGLEQNYQALFSIQAVTVMLLATACQLILFTTKLFPVVRERWSHDPNHPLLKSQPSTGVIIK